MMQPWERWKVNPALDLQWCAIVCSVRCTMIMFSTSPQPHGIMNVPRPSRLPVLVNLATTERHELNNPSITVGRADDNNVIIPEDPYTSGHHARIYWDQGRWWIEDLNSSNGTTVNEQLISAPLQLSPNDLIKFGRTTFRIE